MLKHRYVRALIGLVMLLGVLPNPVGRLVFAQAPDTPTPILTVGSDPGEGEATPEPSPAEPVESPTPVPGEPEEPQPTGEPVETPAPTDIVPEKPDTAVPVDFFTLEIDWDAASGRAPGERCERAREQVAALTVDASCIPVSEEKVRLLIAGTGGRKEIRRLLFGGVMPEFDALGGKARLEISVPASAGERVDVILQSRPASGYSWQLVESESGGFQPAGPVDYRWEQGAFSATSQQVIPLAAQKDGAHTIQLIYKRPFDSHDQPVIRVTLHLTEPFSQIDLSDPAGVEMEGQAPVSAFSQLSMLGSGEAMETMDLPASFDWREQGAVPSIRDQGPCGGCWAFAAVGVMESSIQINTGQTVELSEQYLISCNLAQKNAMCGNVKYSCAIGGCEDAHDYHADETGQYQDQPGAVLEASFPYEARDAACPGSFSHPYRISGWMFVGGTAAPSVEQIKQAIYTYGPVTTRVCAAGGFNSYSGGVYTEDWDCYNHAVILTGWDDSSQSWILRNSWGSAWGLDGYMYIRWGVSNVGTYASYVTFNPPPPAPVALQPQGEVNTSRPEFRWSEVPAASSYTLRVRSQSDGGTVLSQDVPPGDCANGECAYTHGAPLPDGSYAFDARASSADGSSTYSDAIYFTINTRIPPPAPQAYEPFSDQFTQKPEFRWERIPSATAYEVRVRAAPGGDTVYAKSVPSTACGADACLHKPDKRIPDGDYQFDVRAINAYGASDFSQPLDFHILTEIPPFSPLTIAPEGTIHDPRPAFRWQPALLAKSYTLSVYAAGSEARVLSQTVQSSACGKTTCSYLSERSIKNGEYYFVVVARNDFGESAPSAPRFFTQANFSPPEVPVTIEPNGTDVYRRPRFQWLATDRTNSYTLKIYNSSNKVIHQRALYPSCRDGICAYQPLLPLPEGDFFFQVHANNEHGSSAFSDPRHFGVLVSIPPQTPMLLSPAGTSYTAYPPLRWGRVPLARSYTLVISDASSGKVVQQFGKSQVLCGRFTCTKYPPENLPNGDYLAQIRAINAFGASDWSAPLAFRVAARTPPDTPLTFSPSGVLNDNQPLFTWEQMERAHSYQLLVIGNSGGQVALQTSVPRSFCKDGRCEFPSPDVIYDGDYSFAVSAANRYGFSEWSAPQMFAISGFDAHFNRSRDGWETHAGGRWRMGRDYLYSSGQAGAMSSSSYPVDYSDLDFEARVQRKGCEGCFNAINVRGDPTLDGSNDWLSAYQFAYNNYGFFVVWKGVGGRWTVLQDWTYSPYIQQGGQWNTLRVVARGADLDFYINGRLVWQGSDSGLSGGRVGLEFYRELFSRGNQFRVDRARLSVPGAEFSPGSVDPLQAAINRFGKSAGDERQPTFNP